MAYAVGTRKEDGVVAPRATETKQPARKDIRTETKSSPVKTTSTGSKSKSTAPVTRAGADPKDTAPSETRFSYLPKNVVGADTKDNNFGRSVTPSTPPVTATPSRTFVSADGKTRVTPPADTLNSDKYWQRYADSGGPPFEGPVDWGGIYDFLQAPANRRLAAQEPVDITVRGGTPAPLTYDMVSDQPLSFGNMLDFIGTPEMSSSYLAPVAPSAELWPPDSRAGGRQAPPLVRTGTAADTAITRAYGPEGFSAPLEAIDTAVVLPELYEPQIIQSADAGDLFETDGRAVTSEGVVLNPGGPAGSAPVSTGIDAAAKEPSAWDNVVDNTGKLLSHSGLGAVVSTLFPDLWSAGGDMMKGMFEGERGTATANGDFTRWDPREGVSLGGGSSFSRDATGYVDTTPSRLPPGKNAPPGGTFPDLNHNGVDDRLEGYTGPDTQPPTTPSAAAYGRTVQFPDIPPYNPGRDDEWLYFLNNHLADGGMVEAPAYAGGGAIDQSDPRVQLIGQTEDVLERLKAGEKPDEAAARTLKAFVAQFGDAALKSLHDNVGEGMSMKNAGRGRQIKGPGGPKDDAVPAVIVEEGSVVSPAKLSNGEFVFPVEAVEGAGGPEALQELADRLSKRSAA